MPAAKFKTGSETPVTMDIAVGQSLMEGALAHGVSGIDAECGGALTCATCHVHVDDPWSDLLPAPGYDEVELLDMVEDRRPCSRLSCQLEMTLALDGIVVSVPG